MLASRGIVVSGHCSASLAGFRAIERGGTAIDAAIAASAALAVVVPHATSLGGDAFALVYDAASGQVHGLNASGTAPEGARPERFAQGMVARGPLAAVVPGLARAWEALHGRFGRLDWKELLAPAIDLAEIGHPLSPGLARQIDKLGPELRADPGCAAVYFPDGRPREGGQLHRQPALAGTLRAIAEQGAGAFYDGPLARTIADYVQRHGGLITAGDLARYAVAWATPIGTDYRGHRVLVMPPNSYGVLMLMQLNALADLPPAAAGGDAMARVACQINAMRAAFTAGHADICDPAHGTAAVDRLLSQRATDALRQAMRGPAAPVEAMATGGTSCVVAMDRAGNAVSLVQSVFQPFGAAFLEPVTGVLFNNRMLGFDATPGRANTVAPGRRPAHTLNPILVLRNGRPRWALASPGGVSQTLTGTQIIGNLLDRAMDLSAAVMAPRWSMDRTGACLIEPGYDGLDLNRLAASGHPVKATAGALFYGSIKAVERCDDGIMAGVADCRREACAIGA